MIGDQIVGDAVQIGLEVVVGTAAPFQGFQKAFKRFGDKILGQLLTTQLTVRVSVERAAETVVNLRQGRFLQLMGSF